MLGVGVSSLVFSAHAEVVPFLVPAGLSLRRILRARGGSSTGRAFKAMKAWYSPRTRR